MEELQVANGIAPHIHMMEQTDGAADMMEQTDGGTAAPSRSIDAPEAFIASTISYFIAKQPPEPPAEPLSQVPPAVPPATPVPDGPLSQVPSAAPVPARRPKSKSPAEVYEDRLSMARWFARSVSSFYSLCQFLAVCSLTWATVVLLGAFVPYLRFVDYAMVTSLLLLEAIRLASAAFFTVLLTQRLARLSQDPKNIIHGKDDHYRRALIARLTSTFLQALLTAPSFVCPIIRLHLIQYAGQQNLHTSIFIFYLLILINALVSSFTIFCSCAAFIYLRDRYDQSMLRYYDTLVQNGISNGVTQASDFGFFDFAYKMLGGEYARIVQPEAVVKNHRKLVAYLYNHRLGQDFLLIYLDADDAFVQQAAVNMVGFWGDESKVGLKEVKISKVVLTKMADKVAAGQVGWATVNSFGAYAKRDASILAETRTSSGKPLLERLAELVAETASSSSLTFIRTLVNFYHYSVVQAEEKKKPVTFGMLRNQGALLETLKELLRRVKVHRVRIYSAYLLHLLGKLEPSCYSLVEAIDPTQDTYWLTVEEKIFLFLIGSYDLTSIRWPLPKDFVRAVD